MDRVSWRTQVLSNHLLHHHQSSSLLTPNPCLQFSPPELSESFSFDTKEMRNLIDAHNLPDRDWIFELMLQSKLFNPVQSGGRIFVSPDYNQSMEQQREITMNRIHYLLDNGVFKGWLTDNYGVEAGWRRFALFEAIGIYDHSLALKLGVHFLLWAEAIQFLGTKHHHDAWLNITENYAISGCFALTELGHGSNVRGIETVTKYDSSTGEFVINTPCESAQKYWIGGAGMHATHAIVFSQLDINGKNEGVHAFIAQIRDGDGNICPHIRIADCGHKVCLNGVDNGRIWFDNVRIPRENLLNSVADVSVEGKYLSATDDPEKRFAAFMAPLTYGRVTIAVSAIYSAKVGLAIAIRYSLTRRAFSLTTNGPEILLLDYPNHQKRLLPLLAKTYAMSFAANELKRLYLKRTPESVKMLHVVSSAFKATFTWHNMRTLQECREACGGQGLKTENRIGYLKNEFDVQSTFEGDNNVLMQQVSKALLAEYIEAKKRNKAFKGLGLEHMSEPCPAIPSNLSGPILRSYQFQMDAFCLRERDILNRLAAEVSQYVAQGDSKEYAFIQSFLLAEDLGRAFSEKVILQSFFKVENSVPSSPLKNMLGVVRSMYALICLEEDVSFLRYGYLSPENIGAARQEVKKLCSEIRPHALALVSSFGIPQAFLAPMAYNWVDSNSWSSVNQKEGTIPHGCP